MTFPPVVRIDVGKLIQVMSNMGLRVKPLQLEFAKLKLFK